MTWYACVGMKRVFCCRFLHHLRTSSSITYAVIIIVVSRSHRHTFISLHQLVVQSFSRSVVEFFSCLCSRRSIRTFKCVCVCLLLSSPSIITYHHLPLARTTTLLQYLFDIDSIWYYEAYYQKLKPTECVA